MDNNTRFRNWQNSVDIDYLSLYIKTWFAFLGTVHELHPDAIDGNGDGSLINVYKDNVGIPGKFRDVMIPHIEKLFNIGIETIKRDAPKSYFANFFSINKTFKLETTNPLNTFRTTPGGRVYDTSCIIIEYKDLLNRISKPNILITIKSTGRKFNNNLSCHHICLNIELSEFIDFQDSEGVNRVFKTKDACLSLIESKVLAKLYHSVENIQGLDIESIEERKGYCNGLLRPLVILLRQNFETEKLFVSMPLKGFTNQYTIEGNQRKIIHWFISFNYQLRNLLFHSLIDPFNPEWLRVFKHAYLALRELVEFNIEKIEQLAE